MLYRHLCLALPLAALLQGCAPVIVGGATAGAVIVADDQRSTGTIVDDQGIELKIAKQLDDVRDMRELAHVNVTSFNGLVLLSGETPTPALRAQAEHIASATPKVRHVFNELAISPASALASRSKDTWITTKVKSKMFGTENVDSNQIKVVTEAQTVYLMGLTTRQDAERATNIARQTSGVERVVKLFEYSN